MVKNLTRKAIELGVWLLVLITAGWLIGTLIVPLLKPVDQAIFKSLSGASSGIRDFMGLVTHLGDFELLTALAVIASLALARRWPNHALYLFATFAGSVVLSQITKQIVGRARPPAWLLVHLGDSPSFPSGHAIQSLALYGAAALIATKVASRKVGTVAKGVALVLVLAIGLSRVVVGAHYPTDVVFGWLLAGAWLWASTRVLDRRDPMFRSRRTPARRH